MIVFRCDTCGSLFSTLPITGNFILVKGTVIPGQENNPAELINNLTVEVMKDWADHCFAVCPTCGTPLPVKELKTLKLSDITLKTLQDDESFQISQGIELHGIHHYIDLVMERSLYREYQKYFPRDVISMRDDLVIIE